MLASALNFAIGFFGYPFQGKYQESITIEATGVRASLRPVPNYGLTFLAIAVQQYTRPIQDVSEWSVEHP
jgi:hypothetical protein